MTEPTDKELEAFAVEEQFLLFCDVDEFTQIARAVLAKWGTPPAVAGEPIGHLYCGGSYGDELAYWEIVADQHKCDKLNEPHGALGKEAKLPIYTTPQPTQAQAGVVPLTPIRQAALDLYKPPFRHEHGYIRDANNQIVSDDASSVATGLIAARIRGWGRIQYMDKPEMRANALQDEVAEMVAEALNAYWAANGIKGGQHGADAIRKLKEDNQ